jgi:hypothetical protein
MAGKKAKDVSWSRFEGAVDIALKTPAKHKASPKKSLKKKAKKA